MDLVPLIDSVGEPGTALVGGLVLGIVFGLAAQRSGFCTRSALLDVIRRGDGSALATWLTGFAVAVLGVQWLIHANALNVAETRFFSTAQSLSGAVVGGLLFGVGMILARGCVSRLLVLGASGNVRALFSIAVIALASLATYSGFLVPARDAVGGLAGTPLIGGNDLLAGLGLGPAIGAVLVAVAIVAIVRTRLSAWRVLGGAAVGATIVGGWWFTWQLSQQVFEPIQTESLSYVRPLATTVEAAMGGAAAIGMDQGLLLGTMLGAFVAAALSRQLRFATFSEPGTPSVWRYALGAAMMGLGGILAVGCTIGAGLTGGSVLAVSSLVALASMLAGGAIADRVITRGTGRGKGTAPLAAE